MTHPILIGTRGWDHDEWTGGFFPPELPKDWRLPLYSNNLRAVLVPAETWETADDATVRQWVEDTDEAFRFVLELPAAVLHPQRLRATVAPLTDFFHRIAPIRSRTAGLLVRPDDSAPPQASWLDGLLTELGGHLPLCADLSPAWRTESVLRVLGRHHCGLCWHAGEETEPRAGGRLLVALTHEGAARGQRAIIEKLSACCADGTQAGLFFQGKKAGEHAGHARLIAEMMAI
jgi:hypothetical protein